MSQLKGFIKGVKEGALVATALTSLIISAEVVNNFSHIISNYNNNTHPTEERQTFEELYNLDVQGFKKDVEPRLPDLSDIMAREQAEKEFNLDTILVFPDSFWRQHSLHKIIWKSTLADMAGGYIDPDGIYLKASEIDEMSETFHHEIKHAKTSDIIKTNPELLTEWEKLAKDENGNSLYLGDDWVNDNGQDLDKLGFTSNYARKNVDEDIAELCSTVEREQENFCSWLDKESESYNPRIHAKTELAQKYSLIPQGFTDYCSLPTEIFSSGFQGGLQSKDHGEIFIEESDEFLSNHQNSVFESELRLERGVVLKYLSKYYSEDSEMEKAYLTAAENEFILGLTTEYKSSFGHILNLNQFEKLLNESGQTERASVYLSAQMEYYK